MKTVFCSMLLLSLAAAQAADSPGGAALHGPSLACSSIPRPGRSAPYLVFRGRRCRFAAAAAARHRQCALLTARRVRARFEGG